MTLGEKLKQLRQEKGLSQPELATEAGIEQSYLSKLENDKSLPSNDILRKILAAFQLSLTEFVCDELVQKDLHRLKQIPDIESLLKRQQEANFNARRRYLTISSALIIIAITVFYIGYSKDVFNEYNYVYESAGVVKPDEPNDVFNSWHKHYKPVEGSAMDRQKFTVTKGLEMAKRSTPDTIMLVEYQGDTFVKQVEHGSRFYELNRISSRNIPRPINAWLQVLGVLLFASGIMGFILERRLFK